MALFSVITCIQWWRMDGKNAPEKWGERVRNENRRFFAALLFMFISKGEINELPSNSDQFNLIIVIIGIITFGDNA